MRMRVLLCGVSYPHPETTISMQLVPSYGTRESLAVHPFCVTVVTKAWFARLVQAVSEHLLTACLHSVDLRLTD